MWSYYKYSFVFCGLGQLCYKQTFWDWKYLLSMQPLPWSEVCLSLIRVYTMVCFFKKVLKDGGVFVLKGYQHLHFLSSPCFSYMDFAVSFLSPVFLLRGVGFHWGKGSQMSCWNLGDAFEKSIYFFFFLKKIAPSWQSSGPQAFPCSFLPDVWESWHVFKGNLPLHGQG